MIIAFFLPTVPRYPHTPFLAKNSSTLPKLLQYDILYLRINDSIRYLRITAVIRNIQLKKNS